MVLTAQVLVQRSLLPNTLSQFRPSILVLFIFAHMRCLRPYEIKWTNNCEDTTMNFPETIQKKPPVKVRYKSGTLSLSRIKKIVKYLLALGHINS